MDWKEFLKPSKRKVYSLLIIIAGYFIKPSIVINLIIFNYYSKTLDVQGYANKVIELATNYPLIAFIFLIDIVYWFLLVCVIFRINKSKK